MGQIKQAYPCSLCALPAYGHYYGHCDDCTKLKEWQAMYGKKKRIVDRKAIEDARKSYCEICGAAAYGEPHHILSVGCGGPDHKLNLIQLDQEHHTKAHNGEITKPVLWWLVAEREGMTVEHVEDAVRGMRA